MSNAIVSWDILNTAPVFEQERHRAVASHAFKLTIYCGYTNGKRDATMWMMQIVISGRKHPVFSLENYLAFNGSEFHCMQLEM